MKMVIIPVMVNTMKMAIMYEQNQRRHLIMQKKTGLVAMMKKAIIQVPVNMTRI